jgi:CLIP-associating protein 1/2
MSKAAPLKSKDDTERIEELKSHVATLESGQISKDDLQRLALICSENTVSDLSSPPPSPGGSPSPFTIKSPTAPLTSRSELWDTDRIFSKLFNALMQYLEPSKQEDDLEYALIIVWEMLENQGPYLEGREADLFSMLLRVRYCNKVNVLEATSTIRDALTTRSDPVYGLTTFHGCLKSFQVEQSGAAELEVKAATVAFGLIALGKFVLRLPAEIAEEELPRLKGTLISVRPFASFLPSCSLTYIVIICRL